MLGLMRRPALSPLSRPSYVTTTHLHCHTLTGTGTGTGTGIGATASTALGIVLGVQAGAEAGTRLHSGHFPYPVLSEVQIGVLGLELRTGVISYIRDYRRGSR